MNRTEKEIEVMASTVYMIPGCPLKLLNKLAAMCRGRFPDGQFVLRVRTIRGRGAPTLRVHPAFHVCPAGLPASHSASPGVRASQPREQSPSLPTTSLPASQLREQVCRLL